jgi:hypothetical protein
MGLCIILLTYINLFIFQKKCFSADLSALKVLPTFIRKQSKETTSFFSYNIVSVREKNLGELTCLALSPVPKGMYIVHTNLFNISCYLYIMFFFFLG